MNKDYLKENFKQLAQNLRSQNFKDWVKFEKEKETFNREKFSFNKEKFLKENGKEELYKEYLEKIEKAKKAGLDIKDLNLSAYFEKKLQKNPEIKTETKETMESSIPSFSKEKQTKIDKTPQKQTRVVFDEGENN